MSFGNTITITTKQKKKNKYLINNNKATQTEDIKHTYQRNQKWPLTDCL
jgi:hypothetical protein